MLQGHIFVFWGKEHVTQKKGRTPEKDSPTCARNTYTKPKDLRSSFI